MPHPYLVGGDTARSVLDAVRAARAIPGAAAGGQFAVWGESQGGHAALWTAIAAKSYAPELRLVGTAAAAPPTDLADNMRKASEPNVRALLMGFTMYSWSQRRSEEHTSELQSLMRISYAVFCLKKKNKRQRHIQDKINEH